MRSRSAPGSTIIPVLTYPDVAEAVRWLSETFGFVERVRIGDHRAQLSFEGGDLVVAQGNVPTSTDANARTTTPHACHSVMVRVADVHAHHERVRARGVRVIHEPTDHSYGERQYSVEDFAGHRWTFTQTIADVAPETWGGTTVAGR